MATPRHTIYDPKQTKFDTYELVDFLLEESLSQRRAGEIRRSWLLIEAAKRISDSDPAEG